MVIGQDWGDLRCFTTQQGMEDSHNPTNAMLIDLLKSIGHDIRKPEDEEGHAGTLFFTNAVLCLKQVGGLQGPVQQDWFDTCARWFLRPLIELINPRSVICLGERAYRALEKEYHLPRRRFRDVVTNLDGFPLTERTRGYAVYHCGKRILNTHRKIDEQRGDWRRLRELLAKR
jgi:DNA polymerase